MSTKYCAVQFYRKSGEYASVESQRSNWKADYLEKIRYYNHSTFESLNYVVNPRILRKRPIAEHKFICLFFFVNPYQEARKTVSSDSNDGRQYSLVLCEFARSKDYG